MDSSREQIFGNIDYQILLQRNSCTACPISDFTLRNILWPLSLISMHTNGQISTPISEPLFSGQGYSKMFSKWLDDFLFCLRYIGARHFSVAEGKFCCRGEFIWGLLRIHGFVSLLKLQALRAISHLKF